MFPPFSTSPNSLKNMISIDFTGRDLEVLVAGLRAREDQMFRDAETYKNQGNKEAQFDCIHEWKTAQHLRERLEDYREK